MLQLKDLEARVDSDPDRIDSISPHPRWFLAKSVESSENKRVEFSVDAKNDKRVRKQQEVKEIDEVKEVKEWRVWHMGCLGDALRTRRSG